MLVSLFDFNAQSYPQKTLEPLCSPHPDRDIEDHVNETTVQSKAHDLPAPKRSTFASQKLQHQKLKTPFRSPLMKRETGDVDPNPFLDKTSIKPVPKNVLYPKLKPLLKVKELVNPSQIKQDDPKSHIPPVDAKKKYRTQRASGQFKSPLTTAASSGVTPSIRLTPTIQSLERQVQTLKRALKVKADKDEEVLKGLARRWTEAGREVAWEIWDLVKDNGTSSDSGNWSWSNKSAKKRTFEDSWGWEEKGDSKRPKIEGAWGWDDPQGKEGDHEGAETTEEISRGGENEEEPPQNTLGTFLRQLGIAHETLGWDENEGLFVGEI